jgi:predicted RNA-binding protein associated with RNAse of E/G family
MTELKTVTVTLKVTFDADTEEFEGTQQDFEDYCVDMFVADVSEWTLRDIDSLIAALDVTQEEGQ